MAERPEPWCACEEIDSDVLPPAQRLMPWRETGRLPMRADPADEAGKRQFRIRLRTLSASCGRFTDLSATPMKLSRTTLHCRRDGIDMIGLTLILDQPIPHQFGMKVVTTVIEPGQILVKDFTQPATAWWPTSVHRGLNLHLPRMAVEAALGTGGGALHGAVLSGDALLPMLRTQLELLAKLAPGLSLRARAAALEATVSLATAALRVEFGAPVEEEENSAGLFAAARLLIERHLASRHLSPEWIAAQLGCSRAHLYRIFAGHDATVAGYVRDARLRRARALLVRGENGNVRVGDVAFRCGFDDPAHFARLFRRYFGLKPTDLRADRATCR
ncbi:MAG: helix-turn-helix domain-containing protein [Acetobacteraceae bacterium]